ncbi:MAG: hypothetical protein JWO12_651 [Frankiales bacterium]|nr:hypothetical protein [Frankiales bacterium]
MTSPVAQPRRTFLAALVLLSLVALVALLATGNLIPAVVVGVAAAIVLVAAARPTGR